MVLTSAPTEEVTVTLSSDNPDVTPSDALAFTDANWDSAQTVTVTAAEDNDAANDSATITHMVAGGDYGSEGVTATDVVVTVTDDDDAGVTVTPTTLDIDEGATGTYEVVLTSAPTEEVTVTLSSDNPDVTPSDALAFTDANWDSAQTVTVTAAEDNDAANDSATITHMVTGGDYGSEGVTATDVVVTVTDDDDAGVTVTPTTLDIDEGATGTYEVVLTSAPTDDVTITLSSDNPDVTPSDALAFTDANWDSAQTVTVAAAEDPDAANDSATITHMVTGGDYGSEGVTATDVVVTVTDDETRGVTVTPTTLDIDEGATGTYEVVLTSAPTDDVTVTLSSSNTDVTPSDALAFTDANWDSAQTVTVAAAEDNDAANDSATITHTVAGGDYGKAGVTATDVVVTVTDDDDAGVTVTPTTLDIDEGATGTYEVVLTSAPTDDVTVTLSSSNTDVTPSDALTFTSANWDSAQTVTVTAAEDNDAANDSATITHTVAGGDYGKAGVTATDVVVTVTDDETRGVTLTPTTLDIDEGATGTYEVVLTSAPTDDVTVTLSSSNTDVTLSDALTFTSANWDSAQTVTVAAAEDNDAANDSATITHMVAGGDYGKAGVTATDVVVTVTDDETRGVTLTPTTLDIDEGATGTYEVVLTSAPTDDVTVTLSSSNTDVTLSDALTFTSANWDSAQTVTVAAAEDPDAANDSATITHTVAGGDYGKAGVTATDVVVTVTDDEPRGVTLTKATLDIDEGATGTYEVVLTSAPTDDVTVTLSSSNTDVTPSDALTFTSANWDSAQTVTVAAAEDPDAANDSATITHTVAGGDYGKAGVTATDVVVTVTDDETRGVTLTPTTLDIDEGATGTYEVVLTSAPTDDVTVTLSSSNTDVTLSDALTFTSANWDSAQTVTVAAAEDPDAANDSATITHTVAGGDYGKAGVTATDVVVTVTDDETRGVTVTPTTLDIDEGATGTYEVVLTSAPTDDVTVTLSSSNTDVTPSDALTFTSANWDSAQTVTVAAAEDPDAANDSATITHTVAGGDYGKAGVTATDVVVTVTDDETRGVTLTPTTLDIDEGATGTYEVVLTSAPTDDVTVTLSSSNPDVTLSDALTFTSANWDSAQTVTVAAAEDPDAANDSATITHTVAGGDYGKAGVTATDVVVTVTDDETRGVTVTPTTLDIDEGATGTYEVVLTSAPTDDVTVTLSSDNPDVTPSDALAFTDANWDSAQTVTVTAAEDNDAANDSATITHTVTGGDYGKAGVTATDVVVTVTDDETRGVTVTPTTLDIDEGATGTYEVVLTSAPTDDVTVTLSSSNTDVTPSDALAFTDANWDSAQTVTVTAAEDNDAANDSATITHMVTGGDYGSEGVTATDVVVTVTDDDDAGVTVTPTTLDIDEGATGTYEVVLTSAPTDDVTVTLSSDNPDVTPSDALAFTDANWDSAQTVTVTAAEDNDAANDSATITHMVTGGDYGSEGVTATDVVVTVTDDETRGVTVTPTTLDIDEGATGTYEVVLTSAPTDDVTVTLSSDNPDVTPSDALAFTDANWDSAQTVTVTAAEDNDAANDSATITHMVTGGDYGSEGVTATDVVVTVTDDDDAGVTVTPTTLDIDEGATGTYEVVLTSAPTDDVTVTLSSDNPDVTPSDALAFTDANWDSAQTVTVTAAEDNDAANDSATITHTVTGGDYGSEGVTATDVVVTVTDDETRGVTLTPTTLDIDEGATGTYEVVLTSAPTDDVTVTLSSDNPDVTPSDALAFTDANWDSAQTVTVTAAEDNDAANDSATITHMVTGGDYGSEGVTATDVVVTVTDDETRGVTVTPTTLDIDEGATGTYEVVLTSAPTDDVTVTLSSDNPDVTPSDALAFTDANWDSAQTVTVTAAEDNDAANDSATITHMVTGGDYGSEGVTATDVVVTVTDDDDAGVTVTPTTLDIDEGATGTYEVVLTSAPTDDVTVTLSSDNPDVTPSDALAFTDANWDSAQTVTVTAAEDNDAANDSATITHTVTGGDYGSEGVTATDVVVTVTDDETRGVTLTPTTLDIDEGATGTYEVVLTSAPTDDVTVTLSSDNPDVTPSDALAFTDANWDSAQTVTVTAAEDNDAANDSATITHMVTGGDYGSEGVTATDVVVTVTDDDDAGVTVTPTTLDIDEGATGTYEVVLTSAPTDDVTVTLSSDNPDVTPSDALAFTDANWDSAQTVTVTAAEDNDAANDSATITHTVTGGDYGKAGVTATDVVVTVTDDETRGVTVTPTTLDIDEGATGTYEVVLTSAPTDDVTVTLSSDNPDVTPSDALTFTSANWDSAQTVTVAAAEDPDAANDSATITHTVAGGDYGKAGVTATDVVVTVTDDETRGVTVTPTTLDIDEGATGTYEVVLTSAPTDDVTITLSSSNTDVTPSDALTFTSANWDSAQTVTVAAAEDPDAANDSATITHTVAGGDYGKAGVTATDVVVTVTDDETRGVTVTPTTLDIDEGATGTYEVVLTSAPTDDVTITLSSSNTDVTLSDAPTFTSANWDSAQTVTVAAAEDPDAANDSATITHTVAGGDYGSEGVTATDVVVTVTDDETRGVTVTPTTLDIDEGATGTYEVVLTSAPTDDVTITLSSSNTDVTLSDALTFTSANWDSAQTVTVAAAEDPDAANDSATITHTVAGGDYGKAGVTATDVVVTVTDDETRGVTVTPTTLDIDEGATGTYEVVLTSAPTDDVTITLSSSNTDVTLSDALTFTSANWDSAQTVTVAAAEDPDAANDSATITHTVAGGDYGKAGVTATDVVVTVTDDETRGVTLTPTTLDIDEGATGTYEVVLTSAPTDEVTITLSSSNTDVTLSDALTFTSANWDSAQTVTVAAAEDPDAANDSATITHTVAGGDYGSEGVTATDVVVTVTDDETRGVTVTPTTLDIDEGATGTYEVVLTSAPTDEVTITLSSSNTDVTLSDALTFTSANWDSAQTVTVAAAEDPDAANDSATITHTVAGGDYGSEGVTATDVVVTVTDDETRGVTVTPTTLDIDEGATGTYEVVLTSAPTDDVTITLSSSNTDVALSDALAFTSANWDSAQTVTVTAAEDPDAANDSATITHTVAGGDYAGLTATVAVTVTDDDAAGVTVSQPKLTVTEEDAAGTDYTVALATRPTHGVTVALSSDNADVTVSQSTLSFTRDDWNRGQTVTVKAAADSDATDENVTITHTAAGGDYAGRTATVAVTVTDDDEDSTQVALSVDPQRVGESAGATTVTVTATLNGGARDSAVQLTVTVGSGTATAGVDFTAVDDVPLTVRAGDRSGSQIFTLTPTVDTTDEEDETVAVSATTTASGLSVSGTEITITDTEIMIINDDSLGVIVKPTTLTLTEGATGAYTVVLTSAPTGGEVTITPSSNNPKVECRPVALTFTRADWNTAQTFLVTAYEDQDAAADSATVTHTVAGGDYGSGGVTAAAVAVTVTDNDDVSTQVALSVKPNPVGESAGDTTVTVTATLNGGTRDDAVPLMVTVDSGSATSGVDFTRVQDVALMIDAGERSGSGTFTLTPTADDTDEADETVKVSATTTAVGLLVSDTEITITDDDAEPKVTLALDPASIREGAGEITTVTATLDRASSEETTVTVSASPVAPAVLGDYTRSGETLTIAAGATSSTGAVTLTGVDNEVDAADKTVTVSATVENSLGAVAVAEQTLTITDEDVRGVAVSSNMLTIAEGATGTYTVVLTSAPTEEVTITLSSDNPDVTLSDALAFTDANWNNAQMVTVAAAEDNDANNDSATITHTLTGGDYEKAGVTAAAVAVTVTDNDTVGHDVSAWLARFGRAVTDQVLEAVADRMAAPRSPGMEVSLAGRVLPVGSQESAEREYGLAEDSPAGHAAHDYAAAGGLRASLAERGAMDALRNWISHTGAEGDDVPDGAPGAGSLGLQSWSPTGRDFVSGTSFSLTGEPRADGGLLSVWGRGALTNFAGRDGDLALDGEVQTLLVGAERSWRGWTTGGILGRSRAEGGYRSAAETGEIEATLTGVYPWVARAVNDHVSAWAAVGYGAGDLTLKPEGGGRIRTPLSLALGAAGLRGEVLRPLEAGGLSLAVKGDVRFTRAASKAAGDTMVGRLMAAEADVWRVRAGVEGARSFMANDDAWATITPSFEVGVRLDGGDAETGFGADVGGGVALVDPGRGVTLEMKARGLAAHEAEGFREWGASAALVWEPRPQSERGLSLSLTQSWGASSSGGMDALLSRDTLVGLAASDTAPAGRRLEAELGYGMAVFGGDFTGAPNAALTVTEDGRDWRLGWRLTPAWPDGSGFEVNLDVLRREADGEAPAHAVMLRGAIRF